MPRGAEKSRNKRRIVSVTFIAAGLLRMTAVLCLMLSLWRLTSDMGWTGEFFIETGFFSHWQVWLGLTLVVSMLSLRLGRYSHPAEPATPVPTSMLPVERTEPEKAELARRSLTR
jgi:hypothetical protein